MNARPKDRTCTVCCDDDSDVVFCCLKSDCDYSLCSDCVRRSFEDASGANSTCCPSCRSPIATKLIQAVCGPTAVKAVEQELRTCVEFDVKQELLLKKPTLKKLSEVSNRAREIFNKISDEILPRCPRCSLVFLDYDGCNALTCSCGCSFCAICLQDCGLDAHGHIQKHHGNLYDKAAFERSKIRRAQQVVDHHLNSLGTEPPELMQLVKNHVEKAGISSENSGEQRNKISGFIASSTNDLEDTMLYDRLCLLSRPEDYRPGRSVISSDELSPRNSILLTTCSTCYTAGKILSR